MASLGLIKTRTFDMIKICFLCKKEFKVKPSHFERRKYCSKKCMDEGRVIETQRNRPIQICRICKEKFTSYYTQKYCSRKCLGKSMLNPNKIRNCILCDSSISPKNEKYCSMKCYAKSLRGKKTTTGFSWQKATPEEKLKRLKNHFNKHVIKNKEGCWGWKGSPSKKYKALRFNDKAILAHRASYILHHGPIPKGLCVCHKCDNPSCTNPEHLFLGTYQDNVKDMMAKKRNIITRPSAKLTIPQVKEAKKMIREGYDIKDIAHKFKVKYRTIHDIKIGKSWKGI